MRISNETMTKMVTNAMSDSYNTYANAINKIISGKNFTKISQNPTDATKTLKLGNQLDQLDIYQSNIQAATNEMNLTYDTLGEMIEELDTINSLVVEASNASTSPDAAKAIATEIKERTGTIKDKLNTKYLDNYIFSGTFTQTPTYTEQDGLIVYQGSSEDAGKRKLTISEDTPFVYNITGETLFGKREIFEVEENGQGEEGSEQTPPLDDTQEEQISSDFFSQMQHLDTLLNEDPLQFDKIREKLDVINSTTKNVIQAQGSVSASVAKLNSTSDINQSMIISLTENKTDLEEVDIMQAASDLMNARTSMQASYLLGTQVLNSVSLLDYI